MYSGAGVGGAESDDQLASSSFVRHVGGSGGSGGGGGGGGGGGSSRQSYTELFTKPFRKHAEDKSRYHHLSTSEEDMLDAGEPCPPPPPQPSADAQSFRSAAELTASSGGEDALYFAEMGERRRQFNYATLYEPDACSVDSKVLPSTTATSEGPAEPAGCAVDGRRDSTSRPPSSLCSLPTPNAPSAPPAPDDRIVGHQLAVRPPEDRIVGHQLGVRPLLDDDELSTANLEAEVAAAAAAAAAGGSTNPFLAQPLMPPPPPPAVKAPPAFDDVFASAPPPSRCRPRPANSAASPVAASPRLPPPPVAPKPKPRASGPAPVRMSSKEEAAELLRSSGGSLGRGARSSGGKYRSLRSDESDEEALCAGNDVTGGEEAEEAEEAAESKSRKVSGRLAASGPALPLNPALEASVKAGVANLSFVDYSSCEEGSHLGRRPAIGSAARR